jgi:hypothetical protein
MSIVGLSQKAAKHPIILDDGNDTPTTVMQVLKMGTGIKSIYMTNSTDTTGKWLVIYDKKLIIQVQKFIDDEIPLLFSCIPETILPSLLIAGYPYPRRPGLQRRNGNTISYAQVLQNQLSEEPSSVVTPPGPPRSKRAPAMIVYQDIGELGPRQKKSNTGIRSGSSNSTVTTESLQHNEISEMIESRLNSKFTEAMKQTDQKIKAAVDPLSQKIERIDQTINANFQTFTDKINQNVTTTITSMFQAMGVTAHAPKVTPGFASINRYAPLNSSVSESWFNTPGAYGQGKSAHE